MNLVYVLIGIIAIVFIAFIVIYVRNPFKFPYKDIEFDVTSKRQPDIFDYIDKYLIENRLDEVMDALECLENWKSECEEQILSSMFLKHRREQYEEILDEKHLFRFVLIRTKTRYRQVNYVKYPYSVREVEKEFHTDFNFLNDRYNKLKEIDFQCTLSEYHSTSQRKLMNKNLRDNVIKRDNYTCQICGKYMPDGVGLQVDHIIPISKGGKSVLSNLQVLCSKCNGAKSNKNGK